MSARKLTAAAISLAATLLPSMTVRADLGGGQGGAGDDSVGSWVIGNGPGGGVSQYRPVSSRVRFRKKALIRPWFFISFAKREMVWEWSALF